MFSMCRFKFPFVEHEIKHLGQNQEPFTHLKTAAMFVVTHLRVTSFPGYPYTSRMQETDLIGEISDRSDYAFK